MKKLLLLHPEDFLPVAARGRWDLVVDLGYAPTSTYADWGREAGCPVVSLSDFRDRVDDLRHLRELMQFGVGQVLDNVSLDWWDLISLRFYEQMLEALALQRLLSTCELNSEISISRSCFHASAMQVISGRNLKILHTSASLRNSLVRKAARLLRLRPRQVLEILGDKYDGRYRLRRHFARNKFSYRNPVVLLPTGYGNASRTALAYASALPDTKFLLLATRQSGCVRNLPPNVACARLAAFAPGKCDPHELEDLFSSWKTLLSALAQQREFSVLVRAGCFESVPAILQEGLCVRDAWMQVFASNRISAVLCADEMNWYTRIPLLLARSRGVRALACHHGALDFRYAFRETSADRFLVKGRMEWDYLISRGATEHRIEIAAPPPTQQFRTEPSPCDAIVFFSEPYEVFGGRAHGFYREVLPPLAELARQHGKILIVKLHPYESRRERRRLAESVLPGAQLERLRVIDGALKSELLNRAWFGVTITSTAAVDCALSDIPIFLCRWLDFTYSGYSDQFIKFGAAKGLSSAEEIANIPHVLANYIQPNLNDFSEPVEPDRLRELLSGAAVCGVEAGKIERLWA